MDKLSDEVASDPRLFRGDGTDIMMPIMDGVAEIIALKHLDPSVKIIAASGLGSNGGVAKAADQGVTHFLPKPYTAEALLEVLHRILNE